MGQSSVQSSLPCRIKLLALPLKKYAKANISVFLVLSNLFDFLIFLKIFSIGLSLETKVNL